MASGTANSSSRSRPDVGPRMHSDQVIDQQLTRTRRRVKLVDLGVIVMGLVGAVILYTLAVVLVDHWIVALSTTGRFLALGILLLGVGYYCVRWVVPLLVRRINPGFAARAIEQSDPSLKNSLINFLTFRRDPTPTGRLVYRALQQRAAMDLRHVNIDLAVDQSRLIHVGYLVVALMILFAGYTIFSPKDVFQTVKRVSLPWANIARPSRVAIDDVQPGDTDAILGSQIEISARILGADADDTVRVLYTTEDNQTVDRAVPMNPPESGQRYTCTLPADAMGIQQNLTYRIEAGDAISPEFQLTMMRIPSIVVDKIEYVYPKYTGLEPYTSEGEGEIHAVEGTVVTVHAKANHQIKHAEIVFDPDRISSKVSMKADQQRASLAFQVNWNDNLGGPEHTSYQIEFKPELSVNAAHGVKNQLPAVHKIVVTPDLPPEISILTPRSKEVDVPVNGMQLIEIRALDPDFGLTEITLQVSPRDGEAETMTFSQGPQGRTGQVMEKYEFRPLELGLKAGDRVTVWAEAKDNCTEPNQARTPDYILHIVAADAARSGQSADQTNSGDGTNLAEGAAGEQPMSSQNDSASASDSQSGNPQSGNPQSGESASNDAQQQPGESPQPQSGQQESGQGEQGNDGQSSSADQGSESQSGDPSSGQPQSAQQGEETEGSQTGQGGQQENGSAGDNAGNQQAGNQGGTSGSPGSSGNSQGSSGSQSGGSANGSPSDNNSAAPQPGADPGAAGQSGSEQQPGSPEGPLHDGEAFERALEYMENAGRQGNPTGKGESTSQQQSEGTESPTDPNSNPNSEQASGSQQKSNGGTGDQSQQDGHAGDGNSAEQTPQGSGSEMLNGNNQSNQSDDPNPSSSDSVSDHPGKKSEQVAGEGNNATPQQGGSEGAQDQQQPKGTEGSESSDNANTGTAEKQSGQGDEGQGDEGQAGSGRPSNDQAGSPESQQANRDTDKTQGQDDRDPSESGAQSPSQSKQQSDSQSDQGGGESGGGEHGGGQAANQPGRDSPGSNTSSDQGNTGSPESGQGETADRGGNKQQSPDKTGQSGEQPGAGSQSQASSQGEQQQPNGAMPETTQNPVDSSKAASPTDANSQDPNNTTSGGLSGGTPDGGGIASNSESLPSNSDREIAEADAANLEHARKATDLVLQRLRDQQDEPDPELLKSLGWTKEELQAFIARWETMQRNAREQGGEAQDELQDALRSLGLRRTGPVRKASSADNDQYRGMQDSGDRSRPPADMLEQFNAYRKGAARGQRNGG